MKNYIDPITKEVYAYAADGSQDAFIKPGLTPIADAALATLRTPTAAQLWAEYKEKARAALIKTDVTMIRCTENSVAVPAVWATYRRALRTIVAASSGDPTIALPTAPAYPVGT